MAENTETRCLLAHVRAGSGEPVASVNCHPFLIDDIVGMHNGSIAYWPEIKTELLSKIDWSGDIRVHGGTDSEALIALIVHALITIRRERLLAQSIEERLAMLMGPSDIVAELLRERTDLEAMFAAIQWAFNTLIKIQHSFLHARRVANYRQAAQASELLPDDSIALPVLHAKDRPKLIPSSLNICITDGKRLVATRFRNSDDEEPPSLYWSTTAGVTLNRKYPGHPNGDEFADIIAITQAEEFHGEHVIVASEPTTFKEKEWKLIPKNTALLVDEDGDYSLREIAIGQESGSR